MVAGEACCDGGEKADLLSLMAALFSPWWGKWAASKAAG